MPKAGELKVEMTFAIGVYMMLNLSNLERESLLVHIADRTISEHTFYGRLTWHDRAYCIDRLAEVISLELRMLAEHAVHSADHLERMRQKGVYTRIAGLHRLRERLQWGGTDIRPSWPGAGFERITVEDSTSRYNSQRNNRS